MTPTIGRTDARARTRSNLCACVSRRLARRLTVGTKHGYRRNIRAHRGAWASAEEPVSSPLSPRRLDVLSCPDPQLYRLRPWLELLCRHQSVNQSCVATPVENPRLIVVCLPSLSPDCTVGVAGCTQAVSLITDPEEKCRHYESGDCQPQFDTSEYTSIVSEVSKFRQMLVCGNCLDTDPWLSS